MGSRFRTGDSKRSSLAGTASRTRSGGLKEAPRNPVNGSSDNGRIFLDVTDLPYGFEGPTTASEDDAMWCMGVKITHSDHTAGIPIAAFADGRLTPNDVMCPDVDATLVDPDAVAGDLTASCSWAQAHDGRRPFDNSLPLNWFDQQMTNYTVSGVGSLKNFISKLTTGESSGSPPTIEPANNKAGTSFFVDGGDLYVIEPRENVMGGVISKHYCDNKTDTQYVTDVLCRPDENSKYVYYTINEAIVASSPLRGGVAQPW